MFDSPMGHASDISRFFETPSRHYKWRMPTFYRTRARRARWAELLEILGNPPPCAHVRNNSGGEKRIAEGTSPVRLYSTTVREACRPANEDDFEITDGTLPWLQKILKLDDCIAAMQEICEHAQKYPPQAFFEIVRYLVEIGEPASLGTIHLLAQTAQAAAGAKGKNKEIILRIAARLLGATDAEVAGKHIILADTCQLGAWHYAVRNGGSVEPNNLDEFSYPPVGLARDKNEMWNFYHRARYEDLISVAEAWGAHCASEEYFRGEVAAVQRYLSAALGQMEELDPGSTLYFSEHADAEGEGVEDEHVNDALEAKRDFELLGPEYGAAFERGINRFVDYNESYTANMRKAVKQHPPQPS